MKIILASNSPRRFELLQLLELPFQVESPRYEEITAEERCPAEEALWFARGKALSLKENFPEDLIIGCDTIVEFEGKKFGKPDDSPHAIEMLKILSGRIHRVLTGVSIYHGPSGKTQECLGQTLIKMKEFDEGQIREYVETGEPIGKAGAYAIQGKGGELVEKIEGDYFNVVGLPLRQTAEVLLNFGVPISVDMDKIYREKKY